MRILTHICPLLVCLINLILALPKATTNINQNQNKFKNKKICSEKRTALCKSTGHKQHRKKVIMLGSFDLDGKILEFQI